MPPDAPRPTPPARSSSLPDRGTAALIDSAIDLASGEPVVVRMYGRKKAGQRVALVVHFHGGAFVSGDLDNGHTVAHLLEGAGAVVVSVAYPLTPFRSRWTLAMACCSGCTAIAPSWAGKRLVYLAGEEAGGNLAAVALMARDQAHPPLAGQILLSPMLDPCVGSASQRRTTGDAVDCKWVQGWRNFLRCPRDAEHPYAVPASAHRLAGLPPRWCWWATPIPCVTKPWPTQRACTPQACKSRSMCLPKPRSGPEPLLETGPARMPLCRGRCRKSSGGSSKPPDVGVLLTPLIR